MIGSPSREHRLGRAIRSRDNNYLTDEQIRRRLNGINDNDIDNAVILWRRIYDFSVGAGAGNRRVPNMMVVFAEETDRTVASIADANLINELVNMPIARVINIAGLLHITLGAFQGGILPPDSVNPLIQAYITRYYENLRDMQQLAEWDPNEQMERRQNDVDMSGRACQLGEFGRCRNRNGVCMCRLLEPPLGAVFGKCSPESCNITGVQALRRHNAAPPLWPVV